LSQTLSKLAIYLSLHSFLIPIFLRLLVQNIKIATEKDKKTPVYWLKNATSGNTAAQLTERREGEARRALMGLMARHSPFNSSPRTPQLTETGTLLAFMQK
jgi:hypothetical protein